MIIARLHRGGLKESMETAQTFETIEQMKQWFVDAHENAFSIDDVVVDDNILFDSRINWNTQHVCIKRYKSDDFIAKYGYPQCVGMCDLNYRKDEL